MQVAVMGFGTVGSGVVELILKNKKSIEERCGQKSLDVKHILDNRIGGARWIQVGNMPAVFGRVCSPEAFLNHVIV